MCICWVWTKVALLLSKSEYFLERVTSKLESQWEMVSPMSQVRFRLGNIIIYQT